MGHFELQCLFVYSLTSVDAIFESFDKIIGAFIVRSFPNLSQLVCMPGCIKITRCRVDILAT